MSVINGWVAEQHTCEDQKTFTFHDVCSGLPLHLRVPFLPFSFLQYLLLENPERLAKLEFCLRSGVSVLLPWTDQENYLIPNLDGFQPWKYFLTCFQESIVGIKKGQT